MHPTPLDVDALVAHGAFVRAVAKAALGGDAEIDDVVQDTWQAALEAEPPKREALKGWLGVIARRQAIRRIRQRGIERRGMVGLAERPRVAPADPTETVERLEIGRRLATAILALPEQYRTAVVLRYHDGLPPREVAKRLGVPVETARTRIKRGVALLRERLEEQEGRDWRALLLPLVPDARPLTPAAVAGGGLAMKKLLVVLLAVLLVGGAAWWWHASSLDRAAPTEVAEGTSEQGPSDARLEGRAPEAPADLAALPAPVDLDAVDRDLDLHGIVIGRDGKPLAGARLEVVHYPWMDVDMLRHFDHVGSTRAGPTAVSASDGTFALRLALGDVVSLRVFAEGYATRALWPLQAGERSRIVLADVVRLVVEARTSDGKPAGGVGLVVAHGNPHPAMLTPEPVETDAMGEAVIEGLAPRSTYLLYTTAVKPGSGHVFHSEVTLPATGDHRHRLQLPAGHVIRGRVTDAATKEPIAGARVGLSLAMMGSVTTDAEGQYRLPGWIPTAGIDVHVLAAGRARESRIVEDPEAPLDFELGAERRVVGRVVDSEGRPVVAALLSIAGRSAGKREVRVSAATATSGSEGRFTLEGLRPELRHVLRIQRAGVGARRIDLGAIGEIGTVDLGDVELGTACSVSGLIEAQDGTPLPRMDVLLEVDPSNRSMTRSRIARKTDDLGRFRFVGLEPGAYGLKVGDRNHPLLERSVKLTRDEPNLHLDLRLSDKRTLKVRVRESTGAPVPGLQINARQAGKGAVGSAKTDERGVALLELPREEIMLFAAIPYTAPFDRAVIPPVSASQAVVEVVLTRRGVVEGRLVDPEGEPIVGAEISVERANGIVAQGAALKEGRFQVGVSGNRAVTIRFYGRRYDPKTRQVQWTPLYAELSNVDPNAKDLLLRAKSVDTDRRLRVRVVDPEGAPLPDVTVNLGQHGPGGGEKTTDAQGYAEYDGLAALPASVHGLRWTPTRDRPWRAPPLTRVVPDGQEVRVQLRRGAVVEGRLLGPDGSPAVGGYVRVLAEGRSLHATQCDEEGRFIVVLLPEDGVVDLKAVAFDQERTRLEATHEGLEPGDDPVTLRLRRVEPRR